jgi:hypothetical protein
MKRPSNHRWDCKCQWCVPPQLYVPGFGPKQPKAFTVEGVSDEQDTLSWSTLIWGANGRGTTCTAENADEAVDELLNPSWPDVDLATRRNGYY